jgi:hypothetical protein
MSNVPGTTAKRPFFLGVFFGFFFFLVKLFVGCCGCLSDDDVAVYSDSSGGRWDNNGSGVGVRRCQKKKK